MELYILDELLRRDTVVDSFDSVVWTERFAKVGDMTLNIHSTLENRNLFQTGTYLAMNRSNRIMQIDTVEDKTASDGSQTLVCTASSIEKLMDDRVARDTLTHGTTDEPKWVLEGLPGGILRTIFKTVMIDGALDPGDKLPFYTPGNLYPVDTIAEPDEEVTVSVDLGTVLAAFTDITSIYNLGFRITRNADTSQLFFNVYAGNNRTTDQETFPAVVFAPALDNLQNSSYLTSIGQYKNIAYVFSANGTAVVYAQDIDPTTAGFKRRVLMVNATDITDAAGADLTAKLTAKGLQELAKYNTLTAFDGEIPQFASYVYDVDYFLGDLVEVRNQDGVVNQVRVTEQIFSQDASGEKSYPTFESRLVITPGVWASWDANQQWADVPDTEHWADLP